MPRPAPVTIATLPSKSPIDAVPLFVRVRPARLATTGCRPPPLGYRHPMAVPPELPRASTLEELLDLEELDRDLYRAHNPRRPFTEHLFGGQVAAQALQAAGLTVPERPVPPLTARLLPPVGRGRAPDDHEGRAAIATAARSRPAGSPPCNAERRSSPPPCRSTSTRRAVTTRRCRWRRASPGRKRSPIALAATTTCSWTSGPSLRGRRRRMEHVATHVGSNP